MTVKFHYSINNEISKYFVRYEMYASKSFAISIQIFPYGTILHPSIQNITFINPVKLVENGSLLQQILHSIAASHWPRGVFNTQIRFSFPQMIAPGSVCNGGNITHARKIPGIYKTVHNAGFKLVIDDQRVAWITLAHV